MFKRFLLIATILLCVIGVTVPFMSNVSASRQAVPSQLYTGPITIQGGTTFTAPVTSTARFVGDATYFDMYVVNTQTGYVTNTVWSSSNGSDWVVQSPPLYTSSTTGTNNARFTAYGAYYRIVTTANVATGITPTLRIVQKP